MSRLRPGLSPSDCLLPCRASALSGRGCTTRSKRTCVLCEVSAELLLELSVLGLPLLKLESDDVVLLRIPDLLVSLLLSLVASGRLLLLEPPKLLLATEPARLRWRLLGEPRFGDLGICSAVAEVNLFYQLLTA